MPELSAQPLSVPAEPHGLTRLVSSLDLPDPWQTLRSPLLAGQLVAAWSDPAQDRCFVAIGAAFDKRLSGSARFERAAQAWDELRLALSDSEEAGALPLALAGFAFAPRIRPKGAPWSAWGDGRLWVPEILLHVQRGRGHLAITAPRGSARFAVLGELAAALLGSGQPMSPHPVGWQQTEAGRPEWERRVEEALRSFDTGALSKVVLARAEPLSAQPGQCFDPFATAWALRAQQPACTSWCVQLPNGSAFVGASPEELMRVEGRTLRTVALAGTRRRHESAAEDAAQAAEMLGNSKDRQEQLLVAQAILAALEGRVEDVQLEDNPQIARFAHVQHLRSPIRATLREGVSPCELLARLHPTPAVGGLPRLQALDWLNHSEGLDRGWYSGPLGWLGRDDDATFVVALRSALLEGERGFAYAGCGLVPGSTPEGEWFETLEKLRAVRGALCVSPERGA